MAEVFGYDGFQYEHVPDWPRLPEGYALHECPGVAVDSKDNVFLLTRGEHPLMQFDREGNFIKSFGHGYFSANRTPRALHRARRQRCSWRTTASTPSSSSRRTGSGSASSATATIPRPSGAGRRSNRPTSAAIRPSNGDWYVSDGYGERAHPCLQPGGRLQVLVGEPGHRRRRVHAPAQHRVRRQRPRLRRRPRGAPHPDLRRRGPVHRDVEQHPPPRRDGAVAGPHLHRRAQRHRGVSTRRIWGTASRCST